jgi:hypothetical protein
MLLDKCLEMCSDELATPYEIATEVITALENPKPVTVCCGWPNHVCS